MRLNRDIVAIILLLLAFVASALLLGGCDNTRPRQVGKEAEPDPSVYNDRASGSKGCFEWVRQLPGQRYTPRVWRRTWRTLGDSGAGVLLIIDPQVLPPFSSLTGDSSAGTADPSQLSPVDAAALLDWLRSGHTAILLSSRLPSGHTPGEGTGRDTFADVLGLTIDSTGGSARTEFAPSQPTGDTAGVLSVHSDANARVHQWVPSGVTLFGDRAGSFAIVRPAGRGRLIAVADSRFASNANLARSENAAFLADLLAHYAHPGDVILFDEVHHGDVDAAAGETVWTVLGRPLQLAVIQLGLALLVAMVVVAVRFGAPVPLLRGATRTSGDYVRSLANLYAQAYATTATLEILYRQFLRELCGRLALPPDVSLEKVAEVAGRRGQTDRSALRRLLATCEQRLDDGKATEAELLDLSRQMERVRKDMGIV